MSLNPCPYCGFFMGRHCIDCIVTSLLFAKWICLGTNGAVALLTPLAYALELFR